MANIQIKNVPPELHEALRRRAADEGLTLSQYLMKLLEHEISVPSQREWLERLRREPIILGADGSRAVHEARQEREAEIDRWLDRY